MGEPDFQYFQLIKNSLHHCLALQTQKNKVNYEIKNAKMNYYNAFFKDNCRNIKNTWKGINRLIGNEPKFNKMTQLGTGDTVNTDPIEASPIVTRSLTFIINQSITTGIFPNAWKRARVSPIFKEGRRTDPNNYRPISVLPVVSKLIERVVFNQLYEYLN